MEQSIRPSFLRARWRMLLGVGVVSSIVLGVAGNAVWEGIKALFGSSNPPSNGQITINNGHQVTTTTNISINDGPRINATSTADPGEQEPRPPKTRRPTVNSSTELAPPSPTSEPEKPKPGVSAHTDIASELQRIDQKLQNNPGYHEALEDYAGPVLDAIIAQRDRTHACRAIVHWRQYAEGPCQHVDSSFTTEVARKLPALVSLCRNEQLPASVLLRCKPEPVL